MRSATRFALAAFAFVLWSGSAAAQTNVTFQVNMQPYITSCQFKPTIDKAVVRGTINDWSGDAFALADPNNDGVYTGTFPLPAGDIAYKFVSTGSNSFEDDTPNRTFTVAGAAQTIPVVTFADGPPVNACGASNQDYDLLFSVDMSIERGRGTFNPATDIVGVLGEIQGWSETAPFILQLDAFTGEYAAIVPRTVLAPSSTGFKFVIQRTNPNGSKTTSYESIPNRMLTLTGNEPDTDGNRRRDFTFSTTKVYFGNADASQFLTAAATVTFNVDLRSAQYRLADAGFLPRGEGSNPDTGNTVITGLWMNGPAAGESRQDAGPSGGIGDWATWGAPLAAADSRKLTGPDANGMYTITLNYDPGAKNRLVAKFGVGGADNESAGGADHVFPIRAGAQTVNVAFGCTRLADGTFTDESGGNPPTFRFYDEYLLIRNGNTPRTCVTVRTGGVAGDSNVPVAIEDGAQISGLEIGAAYPNPVRGAGRIELRLERAMTVSARVYDVTGRQVATLLDGQQVGAGTTTVELGASRLAAGVYVLRVEADGQVASRRLTVTR